MSEVRVLSGTCRTCGRPLVQVQGEENRTYHPAASWESGAECASLLMIEGTRSWPKPAYSLDVPGYVFELDKDAPVY